MTIEERIKHAEEKKAAANSKNSLGDVSYWVGYIDAVTAVAEDIHNMEQSRDYWKAKAEKLGKKLHKMRKGSKEG